MDDSGKPNIDTQDTVQSDQPTRDVPQPTRDARQPGHDARQPVALSAIKITREAPDRYRLVGARDGVPTDDPEKALLAKGGMGRILCVLDSHTGREIVLKERIPEEGEADPPRSFSPDSPSPYDARFLYEARITAQLEHPYIVPVYEIGQREDGRLYYTMRKVRGKTLTAALAECETLAERLEYLPHFLNLCNAVAYAQTRGIIHRDLKPQNVMVSDFGETLVLDWGLAKIAGSPEDARDVEMKSSLESLKSGGAETVVGQVVGTPAYMPPEQADGDVSRMDERSDVYSLGAVLYEILTGHPPFRAGSFPEMMANVFFKEPAPVRSLERRVPAELAEIAHTALSKDRDLRYLNAAEMAREVGSYLAGKFVPPQRRNLKTWLAYLWRERRRPMIAALAFVVVAAAGMGFHVHTAAELERRLSDAIASGRNAEAELDEARVEGTKLAARLMLESDGARMYAGTAEGLTLAAFAVTMDDAYDLRLRLYREATARPYGIPRAGFRVGFPCRLFASQAGVLCVPFPEGPAAAGTLLIDPTGTREPSPADPPPPMDGARPGVEAGKLCAPGSMPTVASRRTMDGSDAVATACQDGTMEAGKVEGGSYTSIARGKLGLSFPVTAIDLAMDGRTVFLGTSDGMVVTVPLESAASGFHRAVSGHTGEITGMVATRDALVTSGRDGYVKIWPLDGIERLGPPRVDWVEVQGTPVDVDRSGRILISRGKDLVLMDPASMQDELSVEVAGGLESRLSAGGSIVSLLEGDRIAIMPADTGEAGEWTSPVQGATSIWTQATSRGEKVILSNDRGDVAILDPATGQQAGESLGWGSGRVVDVIIDPYEVNAAMLHEGGALHIGSLAGTAKPWRPPVPPVEAITATPDGRWVVIADEAGELWAAPFSGEGEIVRPCGQGTEVEEPAPGGTAPASCLVPTGTGGILAMSSLGGGEILLVGPAGFAVYDVFAGKPRIGIPAGEVDVAVTDRYGQVLLLARSGAPTTRISLWPIGGGWLTGSPGAIQKRVYRATGWAVLDWQLAPLPREGWRQP